jgi:hypothetical protein
MGLLSGLLGEAVWWPYLLLLGPWVMMGLRLRFLVMGLRKDAGRAGFRRLNDEEKGSRS